MDKLKSKFLSIILTLSLIQILVYLFGFVNKVLYQTGHTTLIRMGDIYGPDFSNIIFWSLLSMISVVGLTLCLYLLLSNAFDRSKVVGLIVSAVGFGSPIILGFFLIIPATILILGVVFTKLLLSEDR